MHMVGEAQETEVSPLPELLGLGTTDQEGVLASAEPDARTIADRPRMRAPIAVVTTRNAGRAERRDSTPTSVCSRIWPPPGSSRAIRRTAFHVQANRGAAARSAHLRVAADEGADLPSLLPDLADAPIDLHWLERPTPTL